MGLDTDASLFYGITDNEEDHEDAYGREWFDANDLDPPEGIDMDIAGSGSYAIPYVFSEPTRQTADGDSNTITKLDPWPPQPPPEKHIIWLIKAADKLGWPRPEWHLAVMLNRG